MIYDIEIVTKFDNKLSEIELDQLKDDIIGAVDNYTSYASRSFIVKENEDNRYEFDIEVTTDKILRSDELYNDNMFMCTVVEKRFNPKHSSNVGIFWTNEGMTTYHGGGTYIDPDYTLHIDGETDYRIVYIPVYAAKFQTRDKDYYDKQGATYMWRCTACWNNWLKATTIDEAIEEFEQIYYDKLWTRVEHLQKELSDASYDFKWFSEYRRNKRV